MMIYPKPAYRILWTWDYCVLWDDSCHVRGNGATGENRRRAYFLSDYKKMVDFCSVHGINGIVIWGALRAHDDGVEQFRELVDYGKRKGVRILPGVGVFSYGGIFYDPRKEISWVKSTPAANPYSLPSWLDEHPELAATGPDGKPLSMNMYSAIACPSKKENLEWFKRSFEWMCDEFKIEGAQVEIGDYAICHCDDCKKRRAGSAGSIFVVEDMAEPYAAAYEVAKKASPDAWVICETYSSFASPKESDTPGQFGSALSELQKRQLRALPSGAIMQWVMDRAVGFAPVQDWTEDAHLPLANNISRIHHGSQHSPNGIDEWAVRTIGDMVKKSRVCGVNGVSVFGEESPASPPNEANYLAFSEFSGFGNPDNADCDMKMFYRDTLDPLYGGAGMAEEWRRIYITAHTIRMSARNTPDSAIIKALAFQQNCYETGQPDQLEKARALDAPGRRDELKRLAMEAHDISSKMSGETCRRWAWLENWLWRAEFAISHMHM